MIRKVILFLVLILCGLELWAQKSSFVALSVFAQKTMMYNRQERTGVVKNFPSYAPYYEIMISQKTESRWVVSYGLALNLQDQRFSIYSNDDRLNQMIKSKKRVLYMKVPVLVGYEVLSGPKSSLVCMAGPQLGVLLAEDGIIPLYYKVQNPGGGEPPNYFNIVEAAGAYRKFTFDVAGALVWRIKVYKNVYWQFQCRADYTLTDIENKSFDILTGDWFGENGFLLYNKDRPATHGIAIGVGAGISYKFR